MKKLVVRSILVFGALLLSLSAARVYSHDGDSDKGKCPKACEENMAKHWKQMKELFGSMKEKREAIKDEFGKDKVDMKKINQINDELKKLEAQKLDLELQGMVEAQKTLTPEQFKKFISMRHEHWGGHFGKGGGMAHRSVFMHSGFGMMGGRSSVTATSDGGVIVMKGHSLLKYDKNLNLVKEVKTEENEAAVTEGDEDAPQAQEAVEEAPKK